MAFLIKRGDNLPNLPFQLFQPGGVVPLDLTTATSVYIVIHDKSHPAGTILLKNPCTISDAVNGKGYYDWAVGDTASPGNYTYEFEITWATGEIQTVPVDTYFDLDIIEDLG